MPLAEGTSARSHARLHISMSASLALSHTHVEVWKSGIPVVFAHMPLVKLAGGAEFLDNPNQTETPSQRLCQTA